jgi:hypothetical protein
MVFFVDHNRQRFSRAERNSARVIGACVLARNKMSLDQEAAVYVFAFGDVYVMRFISDSRSHDALSQPMFDLGLLLAVAFSKEGHARQIARQPNAGRDYHVAQLSGSP